MPCPSFHRTMSTAAAAAATSATSLTLLRRWGPSIYTAATAAGRDPAATWDRSRAQRGPCLNEFQRGYPRVCGSVKVSTIRQGTRSKVTESGAAMETPLKIQQLTVVVTGANRGIGLEFVNQLASRKCSVVATSRNLTKAEELRKMSETKDHITLLELDVSNTDSINSFAEKCKDLKVDLVINNAGVLGSKDSFETVTPEDMRFCFETNTLGPLLVSQALYNIGALKKGSIIANVTSKVGSVEDNQSGGRYAYRASKSALNVINKSMSVDLADAGISCVLLHPGYVRTDMTANSGLIDVDESVSGLLSVLESMPPREASGRWFDFAGKEIPW